MNVNPLPCAAEVTNYFRSLGKKFFYVTNNSTKTREEFVQKCEALNFKASAEDIVCTANLSACYLQDLGFDKKAYIIGPEGKIYIFISTFHHIINIIIFAVAIGKELAKVGISHTGVGPDPINPDVPFTTFIKDPEVGAVIVGFDQHFSYPKMVKAASYLNDSNVHFIGTNTDERFPGGSNDIIIPGIYNLKCSIIIRV